MLGRERQMAKRLAAIEVGQERLDEVETELPDARARRADHPGVDDVEQPLAATGVRPVDYHRTGRREDDVLRMKVEVEQPVAAPERAQPRRRLDPVQVVVEPG